MLLIKSGTLITASDTYQADILVRDGKIVEIGQSLHAPDAEHVDATDKLVLPGGVDPHTHFDLEMFDTVSSDDHYTGHKAAAFGGTTTVISLCRSPRALNIRWTFGWKKPGKPRLTTPFT